MKNNLKVKFFLLLLTFVSLSISTKAFSQRNEIDVQTSGLSMPSILQFELTKRKNAKEIFYKLRSLTHDNSQYTFKVFIEAHSLNKESLDGVDRKMSILSEKLIFLMYSLQEMDGESLKRYESLERVLSFFDKNPKLLTEVMGGI